jgi:adenylate cyclase
MTEADAELRKAMELDPDLFEGPYYYARHQLMLGNKELAAEYFDKAASLREDDFQAAALGASVYGGLGRNDDMLRLARRAVAAAERAVAADPGDTRALYLGAQWLSRIGREDLAEEWANRAVEIDPNDLGMLYNLACMHALAGRKERSLQLLQRAVDIGWNRPEWARQDADLASLRDDPRFIAMVEKMEQKGSDAYADPGS